MSLSRKKIKNKFVKLFSFSAICLLAMCMCSGVLQVSAASKNNESVKSFIFTTPRGQTASVRARATISETYCSSGSNSTFICRDCFLCSDRTYSASAPEVTRANGLHKTSATGNTVRSFSPWNKGLYLWNVAAYPFGGGAYNTTSVTYSKSTSYVSGFAYTVYCSGTLVPTQAGSVYTSLNTN